MNRARHLLFFAGVVLALMIALGACSPSPKARADEFVKYLPGIVGDWEREDGDTVKLLSSTVSSEGHVILYYEGPDDAIAYIVVEAYPSVDAADVAYTLRMRDLLMQGLTFDRDRAPRFATADVAQAGRARYALFQENDMIVEIDVLAADAETPVDDDAFSDLLTMARNAFAKLNEGSS